MKGYLKEIIISIVAILIMALAIIAYFKAVNEEQANSRIDVYTLVPPTATTLLAVNRPAVFSRMILNNPLLNKIFAREIPEIFLSVIRKNQQMTSIIFSFHPQGVLAYMQVGSKTAHTIANDILPEKFRPYSPQVQTENGINFYYYPDAENHFFGYYIHNGIWVGSYSRRLLERAALQQQKEEILLPEEIKRLRASFDTTAPLNIICKADELGIRNLSWVSADLFISEGAFCCYGSLPLTAVEALSIGDSLARRIEAKYPQLQLSFQTQTEDASINLTGCSPM
ncbi:MAG: hypothetical protein LBB84_02915 [Tannerellaceae bacterium]|jgi:hypothetical protein|nr:hypothetical protein [Tannerellaceae bacterium]